MSMLVLKNCTIFDGEDENLVEGGSIVIENDRIREVTKGEARLEGADVLDMKNRFACRAYWTFISMLMESPSICHCWTT